MRVNQVTVRYERKIGMPNYGSAGFSVEYAATLEPGDDPVHVTEELHRQAREEVKRQALPLVRKATNRLDQVFEHLPEEIQREIIALVQGEGD